VKAWLQSWLTSTTSFRIVCSIALAVIDSQALIVAMFLGWEPTSMQLKVLIGIFAGILTMMGFDVLQYRSGAAAAAAGAAKP
jgi:hypothetical protein